MDNYHFITVDSGDASINCDVEHGVVVFAVFSEPQSDASKLVRFCSGVYWAFVFARNRLIFVSRANKDLFK